MEKELIIEGYWWLPETPEHRLAGELYLASNEVFKLKVFGDILNCSNSLVEFIKDKESIPNVVFGKDSNGKDWTLFVSSRGGGSFNFSSTFPLIYFNIRQCLKGIHTLSIEDKCFKEIKVDIESLTSWVNYYPLQLNIPCSEDKRVIGFNLSYSSLEGDKEYNIGDDYMMTICASVSYPNVHSEEVIIMQKQLLVFESKNSVSCSELLNKVLRFQMFLNIATFRINRILRLRLYKHDLDNKVSKTDEGVELFIRQDVYDSNDFKKKDDVNSYLFQLSTIEDVFSQMLVKWFSFDNKVIPILRHLMDSIPNKKTFKSTDYLIIAQALEGYHHRFVEVDPRSRRKLPERYKDIIRIFNNEVKAIRSINVKEAVDTRNYYSHFYEPHESHKILIGKELYQLTEKMRYLLICCLLREIGISNPLINIILEEYCSKK
ncbi:HEPN domain-containing protein [Myroides odoratimimus]|uniref:ApeA N-terminal domain 1-containing protein n=1 Tax=Myroides odoratimimus TaxID=76832 RepID=UPI0031017C26